MSCPKRFARCPRTIHFGKVAIRERAVEKPAFHRYWHARQWRTIGRDALELKRQHLVNESLAPAGQDPARVRFRTPPDRLDAATDQFAVIWLRVSSELRLVPPVRGVPRSHNRSFRALLVKGRESRRYRGLDASVGPCYL